MLVYSITINIVVQCFQLLYNIYNILVLSVIVQQLQQFSALSYYSTIAIAAQAQSCNFWLGLGSKTFCRQSSLVFRWARPTSIREFSGCGYVHRCVPAQMCTCVRPCVRFRKLLAAKLTMAMIIQYIRVDEQTQKLYYWQLGTNVGHMWTSRTHKIY